MDSDADKSNLEPAATPAEDRGGLVLAIQTGDLAARRRELADLSARLAEREATLDELRVGLRSFETRLYEVILPRYRELDRLEADIAAALAAISPEDLDLQDRAEQARIYADQTARAIDSAVDEIEGMPCASTSHGLRNLYRRVAFVMHPDRSGASSESSDHHELMIEANRAYTEGDQEALEALLRESALYAGQPEDEMGRLLRRLARIRRRLISVDREIAALEASDAFDLWQSAECAMRYGRDLLKEKAESLDRIIRRGLVRLEVLRAGE